MKKRIGIFVVFLMMTQLFAFNAKKATVEKMYKEVQKELGHKIEKYEQNIIDTTYLYYYKKCDGNWTSETWEIAVDKAAEMCQNKAAIAASKTGDFGEKLLQTLIVTSEDLFKGFNDWLDSGSEEYKERHK